MAGLAITLILAATIGSAQPSGIVCEDQTFRRRVSRNTYVLDQRTHCYHPVDAERERLGRLQATCDLFITAYGEKQGRLRCRRLVRRSGVE